MLAGRVPIRGVLEMIALSGIRDGAGREGRVDGVCWESKARASDSLTALSLSLLLSIFSISSQVSPV
eukprot:scaffold182076_cov30-Tisochrysis_lutea.AAC.2